MMIRASQVVPVYPLTQDLQPGDVFIVRTPIQQQAAVYDEKGFLPFDYHYLRLKSLNYKDFYQNSSGPNQSTGFTLPGTDISAAAVAFPSYSFTVNANSGLDIALPLEGVQIGLDVLNTSSATVQLRINEAYSYAAERSDLLKSLKDNLDTVAKDELREMAQSTTEPLYLRMITRVFLAKKVSAIVTRTRDLNGSLNATLKNGPSSSIKEWPASMPEARVHVSAVTDRTVSLIEELPQPMVIGYLAWDYPILDNGELGTTAIATLDRLERRSTEIGGQELGRRLTELERLAFGSFNEELQARLAMDYVWSRLDWPVPVHEMSPNKPPRAGIIVPYRMEINPYIQKDNQIIIVADSAPQPFLVPVETVDAITRYYDFLEEVKHYITDADGSLNARRMRGIELVIDTASTWAKDMAKNVNSTIHTRKMESPPATHPGSGE